VFWAIALVLVLLVIALLVHGGGRHGPGRHGLHGDAGGGRESSVGVALERALARARS